MILSLLVNKHMKKTTDRTLEIKTVLKLIISIILRIDQREKCSPSLPY